MMHLPISHIAQDVYRYVHQPKKAISPIFLLLIILGVISCTISGYIFFKSWTQSPSPTNPIELSPSPTPITDMEQKEKTKKCEVQSQCTATTDTLACANPASVFCECMGGSALTKSAIPGGDVAECSINGEVLDAWTYFRSMTQTNETNYACPETEWVNCMPGPDNGVSNEECSTAYLTWAKTNCPNFKGAAY